MSSGESDVSWPLMADSNSLAADSPTNLRRDGTVERKWEISFSGRKPHRPSKGVMAMVISGLWLSSVKQALDESYYRSSTEYQDNFSDL